MKKLVIIIAISALFAACGGGTDNSGNNGGEGGHTHTFGTEWKSDAAGHWRECGCGEKKDAAAHQWEWIVTKEATATETGLKTEKCADCGRTSGNTQTVPKITEPHAHQWEWIVTKEATATETGLKTETCAVCGEESGNTQTVPKIEPNPDDKYPAVENVEIPKFELDSPGWLGGEIKGTLKPVLLQLSAQSDTIRSGYEAWETELHQNNGSETQIAFAEETKNIQGIIISGSCNAGSATDAAAHAQGYMGGITVSIFNLIEGQNSKDLFYRQMQAFQKAHVLNQREYYSPFNNTQTEAEADLANVLATIEQLGGPNIPMGDINEVIRILRQNLEASIPADCGPEQLRKNLIQQYENWAQFAGLADDLARFGLTDISQAPKLKRSLPLPAAPECAIV